MRLSIVKARTRNWSVKMRSQWAWGWAEAGRPHTKAAWKSFVNRLNKRRTNIVHSDNPFCVAHTLDSVVKCKSVQCTVYGDASVGHWSIAVCLPLSVWQSARLLYDMGYCFTIFGCVSSNQSGKWKEPESWSHIAAISLTSQVLRYTQPGSAVLRCAFQLPNCRRLDVAWILWSACTQHIKILLATGRTHTHTSWPLSLRRLLSKVLLVHAILITANYHNASHNKTRVKPVWLFVSLLECNQTNDVIVQPTHRIIQSVRQSVGLSVRPSSSRPIYPIWGCGS